ncbi:MAG: DNA polymerase/3'-5' exonuclease PolX [Phycisphaeraceae bacterium]|nr:DNA polymerase/3'-5' exonuclease PolX [Phycisphaeraceae bacterium]MCW5763153.1 DNA polymerase/3'-5' exonuclease PolX [Phycisphaeraceae bacterium]
MSLKQHAATLFERIAAMLELLGEDKFRVNAHARAARALESHPGELEDIASDHAALEAIPGVGKKMAAKITELSNTGTIKEHDDLAARVPASLVALLDIPGLGPKTVKLLWDELGVTDLPGLERALADGSFLTLPRTGQKTADKITSAIAFMKTSSQRLSLGLAMPVAERFIAHMQSCPAVTRVAFAGSLRRGRDTIGDIDILAVATDPEAASAHFLAEPSITETLAQGASKTSARAHLFVDGGRWKGEAVGQVQVDLRLVPEASWGAALMYFTGSKDHNVRLRERALRQRLTLNEYGLYPNDDDPTPPHQRDVKPVAGASEEEVYKALGLPYLPPEIREDIGELELTATPALIEPADIKAELHAHTTASDGHMSLDQLIERAIARGFHTIAVTDHSRSSAQANGLSVERLREQRRDIEAARERFKGKITILCGSEVDILADGSLDYDDDVLTELDLVVASPHVALAQDAATATARLLRAIEHPLVHIIGHPTGRLINRRAGLEPAMPELVAAARQHNVALEINCHWMRLDLRDTHVRLAAEAGALIAIDCDVHAPDEFDNLRYGVLTARRGFLPPEQCINTWPQARLAAWIASKRTR